jgi:hypothetical protein
MSIDNETALIIVSALLAVSEALSLIPSIRSNGIFQTVFGILRAIIGKKQS